MNEPYSVEGLNLCTTGGGFTTSKRESLFVDTVMGGHPPAGVPMKQYFLLRRASSTQHDIEVVFFTNDGRGMYVPAKFSGSDNELLLFSVSYEGAGDGGAWKSSAIVTLSRGAAPHDDDLLADIEYHETGKSVFTLFIGGKRTQWSAHLSLKRLGVNDELVKKAMGIQIAVNNCPELPSP